MGWRNTRHIRKLSKRILSMMPYYSAIRTPLYEQYADIRISEEGLNVEQTVEQIIEKLELMNNNRKSNE